MIDVVIKELEETSGNDLSFVVELISTDEEDTVKALSQEPIKGRHECRKGRDDGCVEHRVIFGRLGSS